MGPIVIRNKTINLYKFGHKKIIVKFCGHVLSNETNKARKTGTGLSKEYFNWKVVNEKKNFKNLVY